MKERLDQLLVQRGLFPSREKAKAAIMAGMVYVDQQISDKAGMAISVDAIIDVRATTCPYVGRGGLKLKKALDLFQIEITHSVVGDFGASTGGFTDCMLKEGARRVYAVDVGYGQLDYRLRNDPRVVNMERKNIRYLPADAISEPLDLVTIDVSFISVSLILPIASRHLRSGGQCVCLVKPQFEAGREQVGKHGIVRDKDVHCEVIRRVVAYGEAAGLYATDLSFSPITGAKGNIEYLLLLEKTDGPTNDLPIRDVVLEAHTKHSKGR